jgi:hypothetical protein
LPRPSPCEGLAMTGNVRILAFGIYLDFGLWIWKFGFRL